MSMIDIFREIDTEVESIVTPNFNVDVSNTYLVPNVDDKDITFDNIDNKTKKCKTLETCVLYIDIRNSTKISVSHKPETLTKLYSSFIRSMIKAAECNCGYIRNIVGDRVMVVFNRKDCFKNAINTAIMFNTISEFTINKHFRYAEVSCGIGIDFGEMLVVKTGTIKQGKENQFYKSLVWLGRPANVASKLTDSANKLLYNNLNKPSINTLLHNTNKDISKLPTLQQSYKRLYPPNLLIKKFEEPRFKSLSSEKKLISNLKTKPILITKEVLDGLTNEAPDLRKEISFTKQLSLKIDGYSGEIYGTDYYFNDINKI